MKGLSFASALRVRFSYFVDSERGLGELGEGRLRFIRVVLENMERLRDGPVP